MCHSKRCHLLSPFLDNFTWNFLQRLIFLLFIQILIGFCLRKGIFTSNRLSSPTEIWSPGSKPSVPGIDFPIKTHSASIDTLNFKHYLTFWIICRPKIILCYLSSVWGSHGRFFGMLFIRKAEKSQSYAQDSLPASLRFLMQKTFAPMENFITEILQKYPRV